MQRLGVLGLPNPPALTTVWYVLQRVDAERLGRALSAWAGREGEALSADGKHLRGSRRKGERALQVLALAGQKGGEVLSQRSVEKGDERAAAIALLSEVLQEGQVVSLDAGLMKRPVVKVVVKKAEPHPSLGLPLCSRCLA